MTIRNVKASRVQVDEIWSFVGCKDKNVTIEKVERDGSCGDVWTFTAIDCSDEVRYQLARRIEGRRVCNGVEFLRDVEGRLANRIQLTTDGHKMYLTAVADVFGEGSAIP